MRPVLQLLFRNVYAIEDASIIGQVTRLLLQTLERNPHQIEAWELLLAHIHAGSLLADEARHPFSSHALKKVSHELLRDLT